MRLLGLSALVGLFGLFLACSSSSTDAPVGAAEAGVDAALAPEAGEPGDAGDASTGCTGACATTSLTVTMNGTTRTLTRAQFGTQTDDAGGPQLHVESHLGGDAACPTESSPSPTYTLVVTSIPRGSASSGTGDGVTSAFFDFQGDILSGGAPLTKATAVEVAALQTGATFTAFDVTATFAEGSVSGHVYAEHCASLDQ